MNIMFFKNLKQKTNLVFLCSSFMKADQLQNNTNKLLAAQEQLNENPAPQNFVNSNISLQQIFYQFNLKDLQKYNNKIAITNTSIISIIVSCIVSFFLSEVFLAQVGIKSKSNTYFVGNTNIHPTKAEAKKDIKTEDENHINFTIKGANKGAFLDYLYEIKNEKISYQFFMKPGQKIENKLLSFFAVSIILNILSLFLLLRVYAVNNTAGVILQGLFSLSLFAYKVVYIHFQQSRKTDQSKKPFWSGFRVSTETVASLVFVVLLFTKIKTNNVLLFSIQIISSFFLLFSSSFVFSKEQILFGIQKGKKIPVQLKEEGQEGEKIKTHASQTIELNYTTKEITEVAE